MKDAHKPYVALVRRQRTPELVALLKVILRELQRRAKL